MTKPVFSKASVYFPDLLVTLRFQHAHLVVFFKGVHETVSYDESDLFVIVLIDHLYLPVPFPAVEAVKTMIIGNGINGGCLCFAKSHIS